jgi:hypothetical protein
MLADTAAALADETYRRLISGAQKFMFQSDVVAVIRSIEREQFMQSRQFARPPFPVCWFEYLGSDAVEGDKAREIKRVGLLVQANDATDPYAIEIEVFGLYQDDEIRKSKVIKSKLFYEHELRMGKETDADDDWWAFVFAYRTLLVLNTKNLIQRETTEHKNAKRERKGKRPLFSYHICRVRRDLSPVAGVSHGQVGGIRAHLVRGHLKARKTGLFWWSRHARGDARFGVIHKEYRV